MKLTLLLIHACLAAFTLLPPAAAAKGGIGEVFAALLQKVTGQVTADTLSDPRQVEGLLRQVADQVNQTTPVSVDKDTRLENIIAGPGARFTYNYTIITRQSKEINHLHLMNVLRKNVKSQACSNEDLRIFFQNKVTIGYSYKSSDSVHIGTLEVTPQDCGHAA